MRICILGGGVIGVTTAYYLAREGHQVTLLERHDRVAQEASFANGAQLSYSYVAPLADPAVLPKLPAWLLSRDSALRFVPQLDMQQWRWCLAFLRACTSAASRAATTQLLSLSFLSRSLLHELIATEGLQFDHVANGKLVVYRNPAGFAAAQRQMAYQAQLGCEQTALDAAGCVALEPALAHLHNEQNKELAGGIHTPGEDVGDCRKFTEGVAALAVAKHGVELRLGVKLIGLRRMEKRIVAVHTSAGDIEADAFVTCLGVGSAAMLAPLGITLPLYPLKGYSLTAPVREPEYAPRVSITDIDHKVVYAPLADQLRVAGMVDLIGMSKTPDPARLALLRRHGKAMFERAADFDAAREWCGMRPATPDSKPLIGATPYRNLWLNTGQGALGFTLACGSAQTLADLVAGRAPRLDAKAFELGR